MASDQLRLKKQKLQYVLEQCQRALDQVKDDDDDVEDANEELCPNSESDGNSKEEIADSDDYESSELCDLLKSRFESPEFLEKLGSMRMSVHHCCSADDSASWDMVSANDLWEDKIMTGDNEFDQDGYVLVKQDDIVEGIATFMAAYLLSLEQAKELTPNQLQEALSKTFSVKKEKSKLQKAWDGSKVVYNVASWSATAIGIYQNPALLRAASVAFWTSCRVISKLL